MNTGHNHMHVCTFRASVHFITAIEITIPALFLTNSYITVTCVRLDKMRYIYNAMFFDRHLIEGQPTGTLLRVRLRPLFITRSK